MPIKKIMHAIMTALSVNERRLVFITSSPSYSFHKNSLFIWRSSA
jgi:hypothetical protein